MSPATNTSSTTPAYAAGPLQTNMKYRYLGNSGLLVSMFSFGTMMFGVKTDLEASYAMVKYAYEQGINFFDNSEAYADGQSETIMGEIVQRGIAEGLWQRDDLVLSTKMFFGTKQGPNAQGLSRKHILEGTKAALKRMQLEYLDILYCHRPDPRTPIEETVRAMNYVIDQGWALYWGTSEWSSRDIMEACEIADKLGLIRPIVEQPEYNLFQRSRVEFDYVDLYTKYGLGLTTWSPLASGILTGKYTNGIAEGSRLDNARYKEWVEDFDAKVEKTSKLQAIATRLNCSVAQLALAWCASNRHVSTVMLGASSIHQLQENLDALPIVKLLTDDIKREMDAIVQFVPTKPVNDPRLPGLRSMYLENGAQVV